MFAFWLKFHWICQITICDVAITVRWHYRSWYFRLSAIWLLFNSSVGKQHLKKLSSALLALCEGIHWLPVDSPHKGPVMQKVCPHHHNVIKYMQVMGCSQIGVESSITTALTINVLNISEETETLFAFLIINTMKISVMRVIADLPTFHFWNA